MDKMVTKKLDNVSAYRKETEYNNTKDIDEDAKRKILLYLKLHIANHRPGWLFESKGLNRNVFRGIWINVVCNKVMVCSYRIYALSECLWLT